MGDKFNYLNNTDPTRIAIVETKVQYIEKIINDNTIKLNDIDKKVDYISEHMARQNVSFPKLEENISEIMSRLMCNEKLSQQISIKTKIIWGIFTAVATGIIMLLIKGNL